MDETPAQNVIRYKSLRHYLKNKKKKKLALIIKIVVQLKKK